MDADGGNPQHPPVPTGSRPTALEDKETSMSIRRIVMILAVLSLGASPALADEVIFLNGDRLTGKILSAAAGKLVIKTDAAGEVTIDLSKVKTFSTDEPVVVRKADETPPVTTKVAPGPDGQVQTEPAPGAPPQPLPISQIAVINPPIPVWQGSLALNALFTSGNTETEQIGFTGDLRKRWEHDRLTFEGVYTYGRQEDPDTGDKVTTTDYGRISGKYDHFFTKKFYGYALMKAEHDGVADLEYRLSPGIGVGYQWFESPTFNLATEIGLTYVYEKYENQDANDFLGPRLAYAVDWTPVEPLKLYHTFEYLPAFDDFNDYLINLVAGAKIKITKAFFADLRLEWTHDSTPAPGRKESDTRFLVGIGWQF
jgi:putative salt-induced outer membrane protein YdiY